MVAIKVLDTALMSEVQDEEMKMCLKIQERDTFKYCSSLLSTFSIFDKDGEKYLCLVFEVLDGSVLDLLYDFQASSGSGGLYMKDVKSVIKHTLTCLQFLHEDCKIIHGDLKPENIFIRRPHHQNSEKVFVSFFVSFSFTFLILLI